MPLSLASKSLSSKYKFIVLVLELVSGKKKMLTESEEKKSCKFKRIKIKERKINKM